MKRKKKSPGASAKKILKAAVELLGELGYDGVSARDIAERAGVKKALVFYHFGSKEGLFEKVLDRYYADHRTALRSAMEGEGSRREQLHRVIDAYLDFIRDNRRYPRLIQRLVVSGDEARGEQIQRQLRPLFEWTEAALAGLTPDTGPLAARHFFVTFSGMVINFFTYAPVLSPFWGEDPLSDAGIAERRAHLHWMVEGILDRLEQLNDKTLGGGEGNQAKAREATAPE